MSGSNETAPPENTTPVRSTGAVLGMLGALAGIIVVIVVVLVIATTDFGSGGSGSGADLVNGVNEDRFQAVYLTNGQAYFGKLSEADGDWVVLENAYYLRNSDGGEASTKTPNADAAKTEVVPFAGQVGGTGDMRINTREIQVVQDLTRTSPIVTYLKDEN